ncbi:uncharacterized protein TNCV_4426452 [Trichonephila clavipes]|nr:uncharacterized protein TNCV_4426452 [Trichonephila clavipes]
MHHSQPRIDDEKEREGEKKSLRDENKRFGVRDVTRRPFQHKKERIAESKQSRIMKLLTAAWIALLTLQAVNGKSLQEKTPEDSKGGHQCEYQGKKYAEGVDLPTNRLCLSCKCSKDFTEPNDRQCDVIQCPQTNHLELGCMPVYNDTGCCPASWNCAKSPGLAKCDKRYFKHYDVKGCTPVYDEGAECPKKFNCPKDLKVDDKVCQFGGRLYQEGDDIDTGNPCQICSCQRDWSGDGLDIRCIAVECPSVFGPPLNDSCREVFEAGKCCAVRVECDKDGEKKKPEKTCEYGGRTYRLGEKIYPEEEPCLICTCNEQWTGLYGNSCKVHDCALERERKQLLKGCLPIYHEAACCPIEFFCGTAEEGFENKTVPVLNAADIESGNTCLFKGAHYKLSPTPNDDYENCPFTYTPGQCCPTYECNTGLHHLAPRAPMPQCSPVQCPQGCTEVTIHNSCPFCQCQEKLCSPPQCAPECAVHYEEGKCPTCKCSEDQDETPLILQCSPIKCPANCHEVVSSFGCPMCVCGAICTPPKCEPDCRLQRDVPVGECPGCVCESGHEVGALQCSPVKCPATCREAVGESGCPSCICDTVCSPPKCEPGCKVDTSPQPPGSCPGCVCGDQEPAPKLQCAPVKCGPLCHEAFDGSGCPSCICDPLCSPPACKEGCRLEYNPTLGPCPGCVCNATREDCPRVQCGNQCEEKVGQDGCPTCFCGPLCTTPKCDAGCHLEHDRLAGPCPSCVCFDQEVLGLQCSMPKCDDDCLIDYNARPCPTCTCGVTTGIQCSPPKCEGGCRIDYSAKPCPACVCNETKSDLPMIQCSMPKCEDGCRIDFNAKPCPTCTCVLRSSPRRPPQCSLPRCDPGCEIDYRASPCPTCVCRMQFNFCPPKCEPGCEIDYNTKPCPSCACGSKDASGITCSPPKCDPGCQVDVSAKPCPTCVCLGSKSGILCSPPKCNEGCRIDYNAKPCPVCVCNGRTTGVSGILCSPPKCDPGCKINYDSRPCPSCSCGGTPTGGIPDIMCSPPKCDEGCRIDYNTKPCPSCSCTDKNPPTLQCSMPRCAPGCSVDYTTKPCPGCSCKISSAPVFSSAGLPTIQCSMPKCDPGCTIDYSTKPCPSCTCQIGGLPTIQCSMPKCDPGCTIDYSTKPCPSCTCQIGGLPTLQCSMPKCDPGCTIDHSTKPCPGCKCQTGGLPTIQCSMPKCDPGCSIDYSSKPCPSCSCQGGGAPTIQCSPPKCDPGCTIDFTTKPCPACKCGGTISFVQCAPVKCEIHCQQVVGGDGCPTCQCPVCSPPRCGSGCRVDANTRPCPTCVCDRYQRRYALQMNVFSDPFCSTMKCGPGCQRALTPPSPSERCPMCICRGKSGESLTCAAMRCELPCRFERFSEHGCPSCICNPIPCPEIDCPPGHAPKKSNWQRCPRCQPIEPQDLPVLQCSPPKCDPGCNIDYSTQPCPSCSCKGT